MTLLGSGTPDVIGKDCDAAQLPAESVHVNHF